MHLVERLTRIDADTLLYEFIVSDPETWTSSWTAAVPMPRNPEPMFDYACHEGNYSMPVMLGGTQVGRERKRGGQTGSNSWRGRASHRRVRPRSA